MARRAEHAQAASTEVVHAAVADELVLLRDALVRQLSDAGFEVTSCEPRLDDLLDLAGRVDVIATDFDLVDGTVVDLAHLLPSDAATRVLVLSDHTDPAKMRAALHAGVGGWVNKTKVTTAELIQFLDNVVNGAAAFDPSSSAAVAELMRRPTSAEPPTLTSREREVLKLVADGMNTRQIARELFLSEETVKTHVLRARTKLDAATRPHAVKVAKELGLI